MTQLAAGPGVLLKGRKVLRFPIMCIKQSGDVPNISPSIMDCGRFAPRCPGLASIRKRCVYLENAAGGGGLTGHRCDQTPGHERETIWNEVMWVYPIPEGGDSGSGARVMW